MPPADYTIECYSDYSNAIPAGTIPEADEANNRASSLFTLKVRTTTPEGPMEIDRLRPFASRGWLVTVRGEATGPIELQASPNLKDWEILRSYTNLNSVDEVTEIGAFPRRFFRLLKR